MSTSSGGSITSETISRVDYEVINRTSTFLADTFHPNPYYDKLEHLYDSVQENIDFDVDVSLFITDDGEFDEEAYLEYMETTYGDNLDMVLDSFEDTEERAPAMPPASSPAIVYRRVEDCEIVDLGSGDCTKLSRCQAKKIIATDIAPVQTRHFDQVEKLDAENITGFLQQFKAEKVLTSYNVLTQIPNLHEIKLHDGIHLYPDTDFMKNNLGCQLVGEKQLRCVGRKGVIYEDYIHEELEKGDPVTTGYKIQNYFKEERLPCKTRGRIKINEFFCPIENLQYRIPNLTPTRKYDGVSMMLMINAGKGWLKMRNGYGIEIESPNRKINTLLLVEKLPKVGKPQAFVLLRVLKHKGWYPYHGLTTLKNYCASIALDIDGVKIFAPGDTRLDIYPYDGYIYRIQETDFRFKEKMTIDVVNPHSLVYDLEDQYGIQSSFSEILNCEIGEYEIRKEEFEYKFYPVCVRKDKTIKQATPIENVVRMIRWL